jgi:exodeoxyribonuclease VII large subunit
MLYTVRELTQYIKHRLQDDPSLCEVSVRGEISNFTHHTSGHMYFTLKDEHSQLNCVMFRGANSKLKFKPGTGLKVVCSGDITVYEKRGIYQLTVWDIQPDGIGALYQAFEQLKTQLSERGFFDPARKRPLPLFPKTIGIVTSRTGAVLHDILNVIRRRFPAVRIVLAQTRVQGEGAAAEIAGAIEQMNKLSRTYPIDVLIVARGGGSIEELWQFNELQVAEAVFDSEIPIVSAVEQLRQQIAGHKIRLDHAIRRTVEMSGDRLTRAERGVVHPRDRINQLRQYIDELTRQMHTTVTHRLQLRRKDLSMLGATLHALSPLNHLQRGYSIVLRMPDRAVVKTIDAVSAGSDLQIMVTDGKIGCRVCEIKEGWDHE